MIITLSGVPGSGKTTAAKMLSEKLKLKHYYMGGIRRKLAKERGMTIDEFNKLGEKDSSTDRVVDDFLIKLGKTEDNFIAEGRTAPFFIPNSFKIFMDVKTEVGAQRILDELTKKQHERNERAAQDLKEEVRLLRKRIASDKKRYHTYYGIDIFKPSMYDLWIDTSTLSPEQVVFQILEKIRKL